MSISYKKSGVDKEEGYKAVKLMKEHVSKTHNKFVLNNLGSFGAMYELPKYKNPVLVSGTDGVGTKLEIAFSLGKYDTIGIDCVAMCVNDVLCHGAKPIFFLDYIACGHLDSKKASEIVMGISNGCLQAGVALIGGETAEMPGFYKDGDYDVAGFCVGIVEKDKLIDGSNVKEGDVILGISSSGFHSNGYSLIRKVFTDYNEVMNGEKIGNILLTPTKIYVEPVLKLLEKYNIKGMSHITGGGLIENLPRCMPKNLSPVVYKNKIKSGDLFKLIAERAQIPEKEMFGTFNMGIGFTLVVDRKDVENIISDLKNMNEYAYEIGYIKSGDNELCLI